MTKLSGFIGLIVLNYCLQAAGMPDHVPGRLILGVRPDADPAASKRALAQYRTAVRRAVPELGMQIVEVPEESSDTILTALRGSGLFRYVERDFYAHTAATPNDPSYPLQWHLPQIQAPQAWAVTTGSSSITVAVIDSGVDASHPDLAPKLVPGWNFVAGTSTVFDYLGHGTAVAGIAAAASNNGTGGAGVSWGSTIMPVVVVDASGSAPYSTLALGIQYAADHNARVLNISVGGPSPSALLQSAVDYAWSKGAVIFAAAMNDSSSTPNYPAACTGAIAVSATDNYDRLAAFSNYGRWIALAAPGSAILSSAVGGGENYWYGTSFASPIAAGVAALVLAVNPALTNAQVAAILEQNADDLGAPGFDSSFGWGRVNAYKAVAAAQKTLLPVTVSVSPAGAVLSAGQSLQLAAAVTGSSGGVTWALSSPVGAISANGLYTAPSSIESAQDVTVTATAGGKSAAATISIHPAATFRRGSGGPGR